MKLYPVINNNYANVTFGVTNSIYGPPPVLSSNRIDLAKQSDVTKYVVGTLMAKTTSYDTTSNVQIFDSSAASAHPFAGVFFDEVASSSAFLTVISGGTVTDGFFEIASQNNIGTLWVYESLVGYNSGTTDIDWLVTNGYASIQVIVEGSVPIKLVQFNQMVVGA